MHGIFNVYKPSGMTSHDVIRKIRRMMPKKTKVGHCGTLDPSARGVLVVCVGKATKSIEFLMGYDKAYIGELVLGITTDTQDAEGNIIKTVEDFALSIDDINEAFERFKGEIWQIPPMYSALKRDGKKLYELARAGQVVEREPRRINVYDLRLLGVNKGSPEALSKGDRISFKALVSTGTYIRTLCYDIGENLSCGAHLDNLERTQCGPFTSLESCFLDEMEKAFESGNLKDFLMPIERGLMHLPEVHVKDSSVCHVINGVPLYEAGIAYYPDDLKDGHHVRLHSQRGELLGIGLVSSDKGVIFFRPIKLLIPIL